MEWVTKCFLLNDEAPATLQRFGDHSRSLCSHLLLALAVRASLLLFVTQTWTNLPCIYHMYFYHEQAHYYLLHIAKDRSSLTLVINHGKSNMDDPPVQHGSFWNGRDGMAWKTGSICENYCTKEGFCCSRRRRERKRLQGSGSIYCTIQNGKESPWGWPYSIVYCT